jgi:hypothetical protein
MENMFNGDLPIVNAEVIVGIVKTPSEKSGIDFDIKYVTETIPVEVLSVSFNTNNMRVRYIANIWSDEPKIETTDIGANPFFEKFKIGCK